MLKNVSETAIRASGGYRARYDTLTISDLADGAVDGQIVSLRDARDHRHVYLLRDIYRDYEGPGSVPERIDVLEVENPSVVAFSLGNVSRPQQTPAPGETIYEGTALVGDRAGRQQRWLFYYSIW